MYTEKVRSMLAARGGEYVTANPNAVAPIFLKRARNMTLENDLWETEPGTRKLNAVAITGTPTIGTLVDYQPSARVARLIACGRDGTVWKSENAGISYSILLSGLPAARLTVPVEGGQEETGREKKLFLFNGDVPYVLRGDADLSAALAAPTTPTLLRLAATGAINIGDHRYVVTEVTRQGESAPSAGVAITVENLNNAKVKVTLALPSSIAVISRRIYRTEADDTELWLLTTITDANQTEYEDNTADGDLQDTRAPTYDSTAPVHRISRPHPDWATGGAQPSAGFILEGRLAVILGHFIYVSAREDHEDFLSDPRLFAIFTGKGEGLVGGVYWRQQGWVFKRPRGIYRIDSSNIAISAWQVHEHTFAVGLAGPLALAVVKGTDQNQFFDDVVFIDPEGSWHRLSKAQAYQEGDVNAASISEGTYGKFIRDNVDKLRLPFAQMVYVNGNEEIQAALTQRGAATNGLRIKANLKRTRDYGIRFHHSTFPECEALVLKLDNDGVSRPIAGGTVGFVRQLDQAIYSDAGVAYTSEFWTYDDDFADENPAMALLKKNYHFLIVEGVSVGDWSITIDVYRDGVFKKRLTVALRGKDEAAFELDEDQLDVAHLDPDRPLRRTKRLTGRGYRIGFRGYIATAGQYFKISRLQVLYSVGGGVGAPT